MYMYTYIQVADARDAHAATEQQLAAMHKQVQEMHGELKAAHKRADDNAGAASAAEAQLLSKIAEINEKCARCYQDRDGTVSQKSVTYYICYTKSLY
jgi:predicted  nucleic acid-binding Zn-ribbon protein